MLEFIPQKAMEAQQLAESLESAGIPVRACECSQLSLVLFLDCLNRGDWQGAREHSLTLAKLLPDYPPSLAVLFR